MLVKVPLFTQTFQRLPWNYSRGLLPDDFSPRTAGKTLQRTVPANDTPTDFHHHTNTDRFDNAFVEIFQRFVFGRLIF